MIDVEEFLLRARAWLKENLTPLPQGVSQSDRLEWDEEGDLSRELQRLLFDAGYAGIAFPEEYGGRGLTVAHQKAFADEASGYEMPLRFDILLPTSEIICPMRTSSRLRSTPSASIPASRLATCPWVSAPKTSMTRSKPRSRNLFRW